MSLHPLRLAPGADLRLALEAAVVDLPACSAFVVSGIGSLVEARLRLAGEAEERGIAGPLEIVALSGTLTRDGAHLHMAVADAHGQVIGGHVGPGCVVRTTAELLLATLPGHLLRREFDPATGYKELVVQPREPGPDG